MDSRVSTNVNNCCSLFSSHCCNRAKNFLLKYDKRIAIISNICNLLYASLNNINEDGTKSAALGFAIANLVFTAAVSRWLTLDKSLAQHQHANEKITEIEKIYKREELSIPLSIRLIDTKALGISIISGTKILILTHFIYGLVNSSIATAAYLTEDKKIGNSWIGFSFTIAIVISGLIIDYLTSLCNEKSSKCSK